MSYLSLSLHNLHWLGFSLWSSFTGYAVVEIEPRSQPDVVITYFSTNRTVYETFARSSRTAVNSVCSQFWTQNLFISKYQELGDSNFPFNTLRTLPKSLFIAKQLRAAMATLSYENILTLLTEGCQSNLHCIWIQNTYFTFRWNLNGLLKAVACTYGKSCFVF